MTQSKYLIRPVTAEDLKYMAPEDPIIPIENSLDICEFFYDTIQGEGSGIGYPAAFLRLQGCTLDCVWCDTEWRIGTRYALPTLFESMEAVDLITRFRKGHRLILTGGSPLKQQDRLVNFLVQFNERYGFTPVIEIENECTIIPSWGLFTFVDVWNNSPKLSSSGMKPFVRIKPAVLNWFSENCSSCWFKFVVSCEEDWQEIQMDFIDPGYIRVDQIILMPLGKTVEELSITRPIALELAIRHGARYSSREQVVLNEL